MPTADSQLILACVVAYLAICFGIGVWAMRRTSSTADFFLAGKSIGPVVLVMATISSVMSGFGFVGGPGLVYESGFQFAVDGLRGNVQPASGLHADWQAAPPAGRCARRADPARGSRSSDTEGGRPPSR